MPKTGFLSPVLGVSSSFGAVFELVFSCFKAFEGLFELFSGYFQALKPALEGHLTRFRAYRQPGTTAC